MAFKRLTKKRLTRINSEMRTCGRKKKQRATVAGVVEFAETDEYLLVYGKKGIAGDEPNPGIVKGAPKKGETAIEALLREIEEELGILPTQVKVKGYGGAHCVRSLKRKGGFWKKRYFVFHIVYSGDSDLIINRDELSDYVRIAYKDLRERLVILQATRPEKFKVLMKIFKDLKSGKRKKRARTNPTPGQ